MPQKQRLCPSRILFLVKIYLQSLEKCPQLPEMPLLWLFSQWSKAHLKEESYESLWFTLFFNDSLSIWLSEEEEPYGKMYVPPSCTSLSKSKESRNWLGFGIGRFCGSDNGQKLSSSHNCLETIHTFGLTYPSGTGNMVVWLLGSAVCWLQSPGTHRLISLSPSFLISQKRGLVTFLRILATENM